MAVSGNCRFLYRSVAVAACAAALCLPVAAADSESPGNGPRTIAGTAADPTSDVDPFVGTTGGGNTYPGATVPFGMTQPSPDTTSRPAGGGYAYGDKKIMGFSAVHVSGPGCPALGHVSVMPVTGNVTSTDDKRYASAFSHATETARPGYYGVTLARYGIRAEMSATTRTAWERYTFPAAGAGGRGPGGKEPAEVLMNLGAAQDKTTAAELTVTGPDTVTGSQTTQVFCNAGYRPVTVYFTARFSRPFAAAGTWNNTPVTWGKTTVSGTAAGAALRFAPGTRQVTARIGVSYVSAGNAAANLAAETPPSGGFTAVADRAHQTWRQWLDRISVGGGTRTQRATFYTALYHSLIEPNVFSDADGQYYGMDGKVHTARGRTEYTNLSLWDTYRTQQELLGLIAPDVARDVVRSLVSDTTEFGWVPRWVLANEETNTMSGDSVTEMFADALATGLVTPAELRPVYPYLVKNATQPPPPGSQADGRQGIGVYRTQGYVPFDPSDATQYFLRSGASSTLEYALADCGLSHIATALGEPADSADFAATAHDYRSEFDASTGFFRPRLPGGSYLSPFDPAFGSLPYIDADAKGYDEGSAWQYLWMAPQDPADLARLLGGRDAAIAKLDSFFALGRIAADPASATAVWTGGARYDEGNEVDYQAPYTYDALGTPWRAQAVVRAALGVYKLAPGGLPGNDDLGEMSAWYVASALGLYPYAPGQGTFALTSPLFDRAVVSLPRPFYQGRPLVITSPGAGRYVRSLSVDGRPYDSAWIGHARLAGGATLAYRTGSTPNRAWGAGPGGTPAAYCPG
ncbi:MAG: GH92 family glycosyl hydrolase [Nocardiopsaceae bacterium]|nr:GH92 family glycosyl hydrolase [Nocardiopsaceae bacterium]